VFHKFSASYELTVDVSLCWHLCFVVFAFQGQNPLFPRILGHEASGYVTFGELFFKW